jgi:hypothetical protein
MTRGVIGVTGELAPIRHPDGQDHFVAFTARELAGGGIHGPAGRRDGLLNPQPRGLSHPGAT